LSGAGDDIVLYVPGGIIEVKLSTPRAIFGKKNPRSMDRLMVLLHCYLLGDIIHGFVQRTKGLVMSSVDAFFLEVDQYCIYRVDIGEGLGNGRMHGGSTV
jgi:hypothetical protein